MPQDISRHQSYNNRFRTSSSGGGGGGGEGGSARTASTADLPHQLARQLDDLDLFGQSTAFARLSLNDSERQEHVDPTFPTQHRTSTSHHHHHHHNQPAGEAITIPRNDSEALSRKESHTNTTTNNDDRDRHVDDNHVAGEVPARPTAPGRPRRISRQSSAGTRRHNFAAARSLSGGESGDGNGNSASLDSAKDDVFVNVGAEGERQPQSPRAEFDSSLFPSRGRAGQVLSTTSSSTSSSAAGVVLRPNPYNRLNHKLHDAVWLCSCLHLVFFCCLPAIHFMEQSDVRFRLDDHKGAGRLGRVSSVLFLVGALLTLLFFALLFFLVIYFTTR